MTTFNNPCGKVITVAFLIVCTTAVNAATVWTGPWVEFSKTASNNPGQEHYQDRLSPIVWLTRGGSQGLFNIAQETNYQRFAHISPAGTEWAFWDTGANPFSDFSADDWESLTFSPWDMALGGHGQLKTQIIERPGVVHLIEEDIYFDIQFLEWTDPTGGSVVRYIRTSPVPVPAAGWLLASGLALLGFLKRRRTV